MEFASAKIENAAQATLDLQTDRAPLGHAVL